MESLIKGGQNGTWNYLSREGRVSSRLISRLQNGHEMSPQQHCTVESFGAFRMFGLKQEMLYETTMKQETTVCPGRSDPAEKIFAIFASESEVYAIY